MRVDLFYDDITSSGGGIAWVVATCGIKGQMIYARTGEVRCNYILVVQLSVSYDTPDTCFFYRYSRNNRLKQSSVQAICSMQCLAWRILFLRHLKPFRSINADLSN